MPLSKPLRLARMIALITISVVVLTASLVSFAESYRGLYLWAAHHNLSGVWAYVWPIQIDSNPHTLDAPRKRAPKSSRKRPVVAPEYAEMVFASVLNSGKIPSLRSIKTKLHVGAPRARVLREHLTAAAGRKLAA